MPGKKGRSGGKGRKPAELHLLKGGYRKDRHGEPATDHAEPTPPDYLQGRALEKWNFYIGHLGDSGRCYLTEADRDTLAAFCQGIARFEEAERDISENGMVLVHERPKMYHGRPVLDADGQPVMERHAMQNPAVRVSLQLHQQLRGWSALFGVTPADRGRVPAPKKEARSVAEEMMRGKR